MNNSVLISFPELKAKLENLTTLMQVAQFCRDELGSDIAYNQLIAPIMKMDVNTAPLNSQTWQTPFHQCIIRGEKDKFDQFLPFANLSQSTKQGETPLMLALGAQLSREMSHYFVNILLSYDSRVIALNQQTTTLAYSALHFAIQRGDYDLVRAVLNKGINPNLKSKQGLTAIELGINLDSTVPGAADCSINMFRDYHIRFDSAGSEYAANVLRRVIAVNDFESAKLAIACGANPNVEFRFENKSFCLFQSYFLEKIVSGTFTERDVPALEFFGTCGYDLREHEFKFLNDPDKIIKLDRFILTQLSEHSRFDELIILARYLNQLRLPQHIVHIRKIILSDKVYIYGFFDNYYSSDEIDFFMRNTQAGFEAIYARLAEELAAIETITQTVTPVSTPADKSTEEYKNNIKTEVIRRKKINSILSQIATIEDAIKQSDRHIPTWIRNLKEKLEKVDLQTVDRYQEAVDAWAKNTLNIIQYNQQISTETEYHEEIILNKSVVKKEATRYEGRYTYDQLHPINLENNTHVAVYTSGNYSDVKDFDNLNEADQRALQAVLQFPKMAVQKRSSGIKFLAGDKRDFIFPNEMGIESKRDIVAEVKVLNSKARLLCAKMQKEGNGPDILVPVIALPKGLHDDRAKSRTQYQGSCFFKPPVNASEINETIPMPKRIC